MNAAEEPTSTPEPPAPKWGDPVSEERQAELQGIIDAWDTPDAEHGDRQGPFDRVRLSGADASWLAERVRQPGKLGVPGPVPELHLETLYVNIPLCQYPVTGPARGGDEIPCGHTDPHERRKQHKQARDARSRGD
jgi:hypothetical protein